MKRLTLLSLLLVSCTSQNYPGVSNNYPPCTDENYSYMNYCPQGIFYEGVFELNELYAYVCNCEDNNYPECCEIFSYPRTIYNSCFISVDGYLSFVPNYQDWQNGTMVSELTWSNSCTGNTFKFNVLEDSSFHYLYDDNSNQLILKSYDYGNMSFHATVHSWRGNGLEVYITFPDGTPYMTMRLSRLGEVNACPYEKSLDGKSYGLCFASDDCGSTPYRLVASCITKLDCSRVLDNLNLQQGSWLDSYKEGGECHLVEVPTKPLYK